MAFGDQLSEKALALMIKQGLVDPETKERIPHRVRLGLDVEPEPEPEPEEE